MSYAVKPLELDDLNQQFYDLLAERNNAEFTLQITQSQKTACWQRYTNDPNLHMFVYIDKEHGILGIASVITVPQIFLYHASYATIRQIVVNKDFKNQNIGEALVSSCIKCAQRMKCSKVLSNCGLNNVSFYEKCGFTKNSYLMENVL